MTKPTVRLALLVGIALATSSPVLAANSHLARGFMRMEPRTRSLQICNNQGARTISKEKEYRRLDRVVVDAASPPRFKNHVISGTGGAFRLKGQWHRFQFKCVLAEDNLSARSFDYKVGGIIPQAQWEKYGLWR